MAEATVNGGSPAKTIIITLAIVTVLGISGYFLYKKLVPPTEAELQDAKTRAAQAQVAATKAAATAAANPTPANTAAEAAAKQAAASATNELTKLLSQLLGGGNKGGSSGLSGGSSGGSGGGSGTRPTGSGSSPRPTGINQSAIDPNVDGEWIPSADGKYATNKLTGEISDNQGNILGWDVGDGVMLTQSGLYLDKVTGEYLGYDNGDGSWTAADKSIWSDDGELLGVDNGNGTWTSVDGEVTDDETGNVLGMDSGYGDGTYVDDSGTYYNPDGTLEDLDNYDVWDEPVAVDNEDYYDYDLNDNSAYN